MDKVKSHNFKNQGTKRVLTNLCMLYGICQLQEDTAACHECGYFQPGQSYSEIIIEAIKLLNAEIRPQAISIIECFDADDDFVMSAVGNSYGDIYETHLRWAKDSRLNHTKGGDAIPDGFHEYMMPILKAKL